jgi:dolichol-phosphate mannosyltransferase
MVPDLSIVILCYRAEDFATQFLDRVLSTLTSNEIGSYEIILVGNYVPETNDNTPEIVKALSQKHEKVKFISEPKKGWLGWDVRKGLDASSGKFIALIDGDGQMPEKDLVRVYQTIKSGAYDLVLTYRKKRGDGLYRSILSNAYNFMVCILFPGIPARDINSKPKIIRRESFARLNLTVNGWTIDAEIMLQSRKQKLRIKEIPTIFLDQPSQRKSFVKKIAIIQFLWFLIKTRLFGLNLKK